MKIINMRKAPPHLKKTRAFFSIETKNFIIHDCRLTETPTGRLVVTLPYSQHIERGKVVYGGPVIEFKDLDYLDALGEEASGVYKKMGG